MAALMPPAAATECERTGWTLLMIATVAPSSAAASAARWPASPAPMINTSCCGMRVPGRLQFAVTQRTLYGACRRRLGRMGEPIGPRGLAVLPGDVVND